MKNTLNIYDVKRVKTANPSKKNSNANSLIYKQIGSQMQTLMSKNKNINNFKDLK